jgi:hypothetical protein
MYLEICTEEKKLQRHSCTLYSTVYNLYQLNFAMREFLFSTKGMLLKYSKLMTVADNNNLWIEHATSGGAASPYILQAGIGILRAHFNQLFKSHLESV